MIAVEFLDWIIQGMSTEELKSSRSFHDAVEKRLRDAKCETVREYRVDERGDNHCGYIDIVVTHPLRMAIELDRKSPRNKSITKLKRYGVGDLFVITRNPLLVHWITQGVVVVRGQSYK